METDMKAVVITALAILVFIGAAVSLAGVAETKHNFTSATYSPNAFFYGTRQVCVFCHTTHNGDQSVGASHHHHCWCCWT